MKSIIKLTNRFLVLLFMAGLVIACTTEGVEGPIGPQGPQGEQGPKGDEGDPGQDGAAANQGAPGEDGQDGADGQDGEDGQDGQDGEPGTANVIFSNWIANGFLEDEPLTTATFEINAPLLTKDIRENGAILVYGASGFAIYGLPATFDNLQESYFFRTPGEGVLHIRIHSTNGAAIGDTFFGFYRYVLIPRETDADKSATGKDYAKMTYEEIAERFNIPD